MDFQSPKYIKSEGLGSSGRYWVRFGYVPQTLKYLVRICGIPSEIWIDYLPDTILQCYGLQNTLPPEVARSLIGLLIVFKHYHMKTDEKVKANLHVFLTPGGKGPKAVWAAEPVWTMCQESNPGLQIHTQSLNLLNSFE